MGPGPYCYQIRDKAIYKDNANLQVIRKAHRVLIQVISLLQRGIITLIWKGDGGKTNFLPDCPFPK